jgi:molybdopterin/thiamine biosynthesis adenylyltransferase/rhodanese-related sulfurtransferase
MIISDHEIERYSRQMLLPDFSLTGQARLKQSSVLVIGAGGLGTPVLSYLAGAGIGKISIVDGDKVELSNLHRQIMYTENDLGKKKAEVIAARLKQLNAEISIEVHQINLQADNAKELIKPFDIVVDCTDNYNARYLINDTCVELEKPFVYASLYKTQGQFALLNWKNGPTYRCIYPNPPGIENSTNCNEAGVIGTLCGVIGSYQANLVIQSIVAPENVIHGVLHVLDINTNDLFKFQHKRDYNYEEKSDIMRSINKYDFFKLDKSNATIIDVRDEEELPVSDDFNRIVIPLTDLPEREDEISKDGDVYMICMTGVRSSNAIAYLASKGWENLINVEGGTVGYFDIKKQMQ